MGIYQAGLGLRFGHLASAFLQLHAGSDLRWLLVLRAGRQLSSCQPACSIIQCSGPDVSTSCKDVKASRFQRSSSRLLRSECRRAYCRTRLKRCDRLENAINIPQKSQWGNPWKLFAVPHTRSTTQLVSSCLGQVQLLRLMRALAAFCSLRGRGLADLFLQEDMAGWLCSKSSYLKVLDHDASNRSFQASLKPPTRYFVTPRSTLPTFTVLSFIQIVSERARPLIGHFFHPPLRASHCGTPGIGAHWPSLGPLRTSQRHGATMPLPGSCAGTAAAVARRNWIIQSFRFCRAPRQNPLHAPPCIGRQGTWPAVLCKIATWLQP